MMHRVLNFKTISRVYSTRNICTVDMQQMKTFDEMSHNWWNTDSLFRILHALNTFRVPLILNRLQAVNAIEKGDNMATSLQKLSILDVGCGGGILTESLAAMGCNITGLDCNTTLLNVAKQRQRDRNLKNITYVQGAIEDFALQNKKKFDVVTCFEVIEHCQNPKDFLNLTVNCAKDNGNIFLMTNSKSVFSKFLFITLLEQVFRAVPPGSHIYEKFIDMKDLKSMLIKEKCDVLYTSGVLYSYLSNKWFESRFTNIDHYFMHAVKKA